MSSETSFFHRIPKNEKEFEALFREHYDSLVPFACHYLNDWDLSQETVQDVFANVWSKADSIEIHGSIKSYLMGSVRNACLNILKHEKIVQAHQRDYQNELHSENPVEYEELSSRIDQALEKIPEKCREIFEMNRFEGKRYKEIADELGLSMKTVENQMGKALKIMREELSEYLPLLIWLLGEVAMGVNFEMVVN